MSARNWSVAHSREGNWVELYEYDRRARLWAFITDHVCVCRATREWTFHVPLGWPRWDRADPDDHYLRNSLGSALWSFENWLSRRADRHFKRSAVQRIPVTDEMCVALVPEWAFFFEDDDTPDSP